MSVLERIEGIVTYEELKELLPMKHGHPEHDPNTDTRHR